MILHPGMRIRLSEDSDHAGEKVTIWSGAPAPACYWAHLPDSSLVHVQVLQRRAEAEPHARIREDLAP